MDITIISQRYAKALFDLAVEMKNLEAVKKDIDLLEDVTHENPEFKGLLRSPIIPPGKKNSILTAVFKGKMEDLTFRFLQLVTRKEREVYLQDIGNAFIKLYKDHHNIITVKLTSPQPLDTSSKKELIKMLAAETHKTIDLVEETDDTLIGGFVLTMEDRKYDASIRHQLDKLKKAFDKNLYIKGF